MLREEERRARTLFDGVAARYDRPATILGLGQYGRWRRALVRDLPIRPGERVLDVATGTGLIARAIERHHGVPVIGIDQSEAMLLAGDRSRIVAGSADTLPFADGSFDVVVFSYLLRYVPDPSATLVELTRVLRSGGVIGSIEFGVPAGRLTRLGWRAYARGLFPRLARLVSPGWDEVGSFLGSSIEAWDAAWPLSRQAEAWRTAGLEQLHVRRLTFGSGVIIRGRKSDRGA